MYMYTLKVITNIYKFKRVHGEVEEVTKKLLDKQYGNMVIDSNITMWYSRE